MDRLGRALRSQGPHYAVRPHARRSPAGCRDEKVVDDRGLIRRRAKYVLTFEPALALWMRFVTNV
jgi:hypothetical protein